jgi:hypothetical protein
LLSGWRDLGWTEGASLRIDYRFGAGEVASIAPVAKELVDLHPDALFAIAALSAVTLRQYTPTIPDGLRASWRSGRVRSSHQLGASERQHYRVHIRRF